MKKQLCRLSDLDGLTVCNAVKEEIFQSFHGALANVHCPISLRYTAAYLCSGSYIVSFFS